MKSAKDLKGPLCRAVSDNCYLKSASALVRFQLLIQKQEQDIKNSLTYQDVMRAVHDG
jgi:hypothetical protein